MRTRTILTFAAVMLLTIALTGCRATRQAESSATFTKKQRNEILVPLAKYPADIQFITAKTVIALDYSGYTIPLKGRLRMRRNKVVQMSVTALGLVEIAVVEFTPKGAYVIDRVGKRYARFDYSSGWANLAGVNFNAVQALFWNRLFIPGEKEAWKCPEDFSISNIEGQYLVEPVRQRVLRCKFHADADCKHLRQTDLNLQHYVATWRYDDFEVFGTYAYPTTHDVSVGGASRTIGAHIELTDVSTLDTGWQSSINLSRYREVELEQLMSIFEMIR